MQAGQKEEKTEEPEIIIVIGRSGSGKSTATKRIVYDLERRFSPEGIEIQTFSVGGVFREIVRSRGEDPEDRALLYKESEKNMREIPSREFALWLRRSMPHINWYKKGVVVIDGFRLPEEAGGMEDLYPDTIMVFCDCPEDEIVKRLRKRGTTEEMIKNTLTQPLDADYSEYFLNQEGVIVASPTEDIEITAKKVVARVEAAMPV